MLYLMGDDLRLLMVKSLWSQSEPNSRISDQDTFFHVLFLVKGCHTLSEFLLTDSKSNNGRCILCQSKGHVMKNSAPDASHFFSCHGTYKFFAAHVPNPIQLCMTIA